MSKKKILFCGITMNAAGTEKAFLSMLSALDYDQYDVDLVLAKKEGALLDKLPEQVTVYGDMKYGDLFLLSRKNAVKNIWNTVIRQKPSAAFIVLPYLIRLLLHKEQRSQIAGRMWCRLLRLFPDFETEFGVRKEYDAAVAYWGDRSMFYMCDKVKAKKKIAWLHFDYEHPEREDELYLSYFKQCDKIVSVSKACQELLLKHFPNLADRCVVMENLRNPKELVDLALRGDLYPDRHFKGLRILSVMRICEQKGYDFIVPTLKKLLDEDHMNVRWYIIGDGDEEAVNTLKADAVTECVADALILLGPKENPYAYIRDCDVFALPSRYEGRPITVEEAKMFSRPIAVTDYVSAREQLMDGELGVIGGEGQEGIYRALRKLLISSDLRHSLVHTMDHMNFANPEEIKVFDAMMDEE